MFNNILAQNYTSFQVKADNSYEQLRVTTFIY